MAVIQALTNTEGVDRAVDASFVRPVIIFKHSTRCPISSMAKMRVDRAADAEDFSFDYFVLDLIAHREVSDYIARLFSIRHESPQAIVISQGKPVYHASHLDIDPHALAGSI